MSRLNRETKFKIFAGICGIILTLTGMPSARAHEIKAGTKVYVESIFDSENDGHVFTVKGVDPQTNRIFLENSDIVVSPQDVQVEVSNIGPIKPGPALLKSPEEPDRIVNVEHVFSGGNATYKRPMPYSSKVVRVESLSPVQQNLDPNAVIETAPEVVNTQGASSVDKGIVESPGFLKANAGRIAAIGTTALVALGIGYAIGVNRAHGATLMNQGEHCLGVTKVNGIQLPCPALTDRKTAAQSDGDNDSSSYTPVQNAHVFAAH